MKQTLVVAKYSAIKKPLFYIFGALAHRGSSLAFDTSQSIKSLGYGHQASGLVELWANAGVGA